MATCRKCNGRTMIACPACGGAPNRRGALDLCGACGGSGITPCPSCTRPARPLEFYRGFVPVKEKRRRLPRPTRTTSSKIEPFEIPLFVIFRLPGCIVGTIIWLGVIACIYYWFAPALAWLVNR
jgi:hypothetical protein